MLEEPQRDVNDRTEILCKTTARRCVFECSVLYAKCDEQKQLRSCQVEHAVCLNHEFGCKAEAAIFFADGIGCIGFVIASSLCLQCHQ